MTQMCLCGARFQAPTVEEVWALMDAHYAACHDRRPRGDRVASVGRKRGTAAPFTQQGGQS